MWKERKALFITIVVIGILGTLVGAVYGIMKHEFPDDIAMQKIVTEIDHFFNETPEISALVVTGGCLVAVAMAALIDGQHAKNRNLNKENRTLPSDPAPIIHTSSLRSAISDHNLVRMRKGCNPYLVHHATHKITTVLQKHGSWKETVPPSAVEYFRPDQGWDVHVQAGKVGTCPQVPLYRSKKTATDLYVSKTFPNWRLLS